MSKELWTVTAVTHHDDGSVTVSMRNKRGNTRTENYPAETILTVLNEPSQWEEPR
jgi:hypothetical protein